MRAILCGLAFLALATAGPAGAWQPEETYPNEGSTPRSDRPDRQAGGRCQSSAGEVETAEEYCEGQLNCAGQGKKIKCGGRQNNWSCKCV